MKICEWPNKSIRPSFCQPSIRTNMLMQVTKIRYPDAKNCTPNQNWACFMCYLKIINKFLKNYITILSNFFEKLKNGIKISEGHTVLVLLIKTCKIVFWSTTQEPLGLLNAILRFSDNLLQKSYITFQPVLIIFKIVHKACLILVWGAVPLLMYFKL